MFRAAVRRTLEGGIHVSKQEKRAGGPEAVAGNGLLDRRALLGRGIMFAGAAATGVGTSLTSAAAEPLKDEPWSRMQGTITPVLQSAVALREERGAHAQQSERRAAHPARAHAASVAQRRDHAERLHFTINHSGIPDIDPAQHRLVIHGMVKQPKVFTLDDARALSDGHAPALRRMRRQQRADVLQRADAGDAAGAARARLLRRMDRRAALDPARRGRRRPEGEWILAEGADSLALTRSVPVKKGLDDAMIALYQNGERLMPGNGYPMRLLLPGYEGNMNVKFLRRIKLVDQPAMTYYEARNYSPMLPDGKAYKFYFLNEVKSFITHPSFGHALKEPGLLRDLRHRLFRHRADRQGAWSRPTAARAGPRRRCRAGQSEGVHPLPHAVALGRPAGRAAKPRLGRVRQRAAVARRVRRRARRDQDAGARIRSPSPTSTTTASRAGASTPKGRSNMSTRKPLCRSLRCSRWRSRRPRRLRRVARPRQADHRSRHQGLGHHRPAGRHQPAARQRHRRRGRQALRREGLHRLPRRRRQGRHERRAGQQRQAATGIEAPKTIANFWAQSTTLFDYHPPRDAVDDAAHAHATTRSMR